MWKYVLKRLLLLIPVMLGTILVVFFIMDQSDVDPAKVMLGDAATEETIAQLHEELGLDDPFLVRYARYVLNLIKGDMGTSYNYHTPVANQIAARLPNTILLAGTAVLLKEQRCYYAGAVFTRCTMEQHSSPFGISGAYYSAYAYGSVFRKNYAAVYHPHPFTCALLTAVVTGKYIVHLIFKSTFALGEFPASAFRNLNMNIVRAGKSRIGMETAFVFASHIENRAELTKSRSIAYTPQCA